MQTLNEIYQKHKKGDWPDKGDVHSYIEVYEEILKPYRHTAKNILEIGLMSGESLRMWDEYFSGTVYGMDCDIKPINGMADLTQAIKDGLNIVIGDATKEEEIEKHFSGIKWDVVIDDGSHQIEHQMQTVKIFTQRLADGGLIILEDIQDLDKEMWRFKVMELTLNVQIIDRRSVKGRYDDIIIVIKNPK